MIYQDNHVTIIFVPKNQPQHRQLCNIRDGHSVTECLCIFIIYNAVLSDDKDKFQERETNQIITGSDSSVTAAIIYYYGVASNISFDISFTETNKLSPAAACMLKPDCSVEQIPSQ